MGKFIVYLFVGIIVHALMWGNQLAGLWTLAMIIGWPIFVIVWAAKWLGIGLLIGGGVVLGVLIVLGVVSLFIKK